MLIATRILILVAILIIIFPFLPALIILVPFIELWNRVQARKEYAPEVEFYESFPAENDTSDRNRATSPPLPVDSLQEMKYRQFRRRWRWIKITIVSAIPLLLIVCLLSSRLQPVGNISPAWLIALLAVLFTATVFLIKHFMEKRLLEQLFRKKKEFLSHHPRPAFHCKSKIDRWKMALCYDSEREAILALKLAQYIRSDQPIYPGDSILLLTHIDYPDFLRKMNKIGTLKEALTVQDILSQWDLLLRATDPDTVEFPPCEFGQSSPPERSAFLEFLWEIESIDAASHHPSKMWEELERRPPFRYRDFAAMWPDEKQAKIALYLCDATLYCSQLDFKNIPMLYPNDPVLFLEALIDADDDLVPSLESIIRDRYGISCEEENPDPAYSTLTLEELVADIHEKITSQG